MPDNDTLIAWKLGLTYAQYRCIKGFRYFRHIQADGRGNAAHIVRVRKKLSKLGINIVTVRQFGHTMEHEDWEKYKALIEKTEQELGLKENDV